MNPEDFWAIHIATLRVYTWQLGIVRTTLKANSIEKLAKCPVTTATHFTAWGKIEHLKLTLKCVILSQRVVRFGCDHWTVVSCLTFCSFIEQNGPTLLMLYVTIPVDDSCLNWPPPTLQHGPTKHHYITPFALNLFFQKFLCHFTEKILAA